MICYFFLKFLTAHISEKYLLARKAAIRFLSQRCQILPRLPSTNDKHYRELKSNELTSWQVAIVTGASKGIGAGIANALSAEGAPPWS
jgi:hypothetical protein